MMIISRDPYARQELRRETVYTNDGCSWCAQRRKSNRLFQYRVETDGGNTSVIKGLFCSIECKRAYHGE
jgi:hypothetical protein